MAACVYKRSTSWQGAWILRRAGKIERVLTQQRGAIGLQLQKWQQSHARKMFETLMRGLGSLTATR